MPGPLPKMRSSSEVADGISGSSWNALIEAVVAARNITAGPGLIVRSTPSGTVISLAAAENGPFRCIVTAREQGAGVTVEGWSIPSEVFYTVRVPERPDMDPIPNLQPAIGRPVQADEALIFAREVGAPGVIWREKVDPATHDGREYEWRLALQEYAPIDDECEEATP